MAYWMVLALIALVGYLIGSIPFAYLITKYRTGLDLRELGSKNIGTMNAYEVTSRKWLGLAVFVADFLKGLLPTLLVILLIPESFGGLAVALIVPSLVLGHCYPIWLRFHGGRGLATLAGAALVVSFPMVAAWFVFYFIARKIRDNVHIASVSACIISMGALIALPSKFLSSLVWDVLPGTRADDSGFAILAIRVSLTLALVLILTRHIEPVMTLHKNSQTKNEVN